MKTALSTYTAGHWMLWEEICEEVRRAVEKHPPAKNELHAASIILEEAGEAMKEAVKIYGGESDASHDRMRSEIIQTAAVCLRWLMEK